MDSEVWPVLSSVVICVSLPLLGLRLVIRNLKHRCDETQAEIRRLVALFEPGSDR
jgi:hypothetical protein